MWVNLVKGLNVRHFRDFTRKRFPSNNSTQAISSAKMR